MSSEEIRSKFLEFFKTRGHAVVPSSSLVPENDPSVLFTTAGMQQFKPYYTGALDAQKDFGSQNTASVQKCVRTGDIDEVGDNTHLTFFEMLGNFSFGGYGRKEAITFAYEFMTKELKLPISYVTVYEGSENVPKDTDSRDIWKSLDPNLDIREEGADVFWGPTGTSGPCGPTTEIYCKNAAGQDVEVWNVVFNEYVANGSREQLDKGEASLEKLPVMGIDTGMGHERLLATVQNQTNVFGTDLFTPILGKIRSLAKTQNEKAERIVADHIRTAVFMIADTVRPSNTDRGYILRRILRRAVRYGDLLGMPEGSLGQVVDAVVTKYTIAYPYLSKSAATVTEEILKEEQKFRETLEKGMREFERGTDPFLLFTTYGFPIELTMELAQERGTMIDMEEFNRKMEEHQKLSQTASAGMFKGGLANHEAKTVAHHTAHHLLLAALQEVLGKNVKQRGSNINEERLRMDFAFDRKMTDEEKKKVEDLVNDWITNGFNVVRREMPREEAEALGAEMEFGTKYPDVVSVYFIEGTTSGTIISKEFCGGPHIAGSSELGHFRIQKEEASSQGVRRIKAVVE